MSESEFERRLPVYLLLDCSESMAGEAIDEVARGVDEMVATLRADPLALETARLSLITFAREAKQVVPLTDLFSFRRPKLSVRPGTALGAALRLVQECIAREVVTTSRRRKGDWKPLVVLLTDGEPTDDWETAAAVAPGPQAPWSSGLVAIACGPDADLEVLRRITPKVLLMKDTSAEVWRQLFVWLSASVQAVTQTAGMGHTGEGLSLPSAPSGVLESPPPSPGPRDPRPRQVFFQAWCTRDKKPYLMRYARAPQDDRYVAVRAHPLDDVGPGSGDELPPISSTQIEGCPPCPYCGNTAAALCNHCRAVMCVPDGPGAATVTCPLCNTTGLIAPDDPSAPRKEFEVRPTSG